MRKWKSILVVVMLFMFTTVGYATSNKTIQVKMNGDNVQVRLVPIIKDGQAINMETPSFINVDRTLVPLRFLAESYGAEVGWDQKAKTAIVTYGNKKIAVTINSNIAIFNNEKKTLDKNSIPKLATFPDNDTRTMVPLAFMSEMLGYEVGWDEVARVPYINSKPEAPIKPEVPVKPEVPKEPVIDLTNKVTNVKRELVDGKEAIVIYGTKEVKLKTMKYKGPERISIDLIDSTLQSSSSYNYDLGFIKGLRLSQFAPDSNYKPDDKIVRIVIDVKDGVYDPEIKIEQKKDRIVIFPQNINDDSNSKPTRKLIVIDPGHGGNQPGAVSPNGTKEKDINLQISLKTEKALKNAGYDVLMTRDTDKTLGLYDRPGLANDNLADLFISIHANSSVSKDAYGIEVLYAPAAAGSVKEEGQKVLAKAIIDEIIKATDAKDRGVIKRPELVVIRDSKMPAILIEVGFLSNANEEKLISNDAYQNKIVGAIVRGIEKYFETY